MGTAHKIFVFHETDIENSTQNDRLSMRKCCKMQMPYRWWLFSEFRQKVANRPPPNRGRWSFKASPGPWGPGLCRDCHTIARLAGAGTWRGLYRECVPGRPGLRATLAGTKAGMSHRQNVLSRLCPRYSRDPRGWEYSWYVHYIHEYNQKGLLLSLKMLQRQFWASSSPGNRYDSTSYHCEYLDRVLAYDSLW